MQTSRRWGWIILVIPCILILVAISDFAVLLGRGAVRLETWADKILWRSWGL